MRRRAKERQKLIPGRPEKGSVNLRKADSNVIPFHTDAELAKMAGVSARTPSDAMTVKDRGSPDDWRNVMEGRSSISGKANDVRERNVTGR